MESGLVVLACCLVIAGAQMNGDLRLRDGPYSDAGRVEIYLNGVWGTIDASATDQSGTAQTICRQLGYDDSLSTYGTVSDLGWTAADDSVPMAIQNVRCPYNVLPGSARQHILRCSYDDGPSTPYHPNDFGVSCNDNDFTVIPYDTQVRLAQGGTDYSSSGFVEIYLRGSWGPVCNMGSNDFDTACRQLGYTESYSYGTSDGYDYSGKTDKVSDFYCIYSQSCLRNCFNYGDSTFASCSIYYSYVNCTYNESNDDLYGSGDETVCSLKSIIALAVGIAIALMVVTLLVIIACAVVCCCCIPGCVLYGTRRKVTYQTI